MSFVDERRAQAAAALVGRGVMEGMLVGAALGPTVLVVSALVGTGLDLQVGPTADDVVVGMVVMAAMAGTALGVAGAVLALLALAVVARRDPSGWTGSRAAWLVPAYVVGAAVACLAAFTGFWADYATAVVAGVLTGWRAHRGALRFARGVRK